MPVVCTICSHPNPFGARFCNYCGSPLTSAPQPTQTTQFVNCPRCATTNPTGTRFCTHCGYQFGMAPPSYSAPTTWARPPYGYPSIPFDETRKQVDRTKSGLFLTLIGIVIAAIPIIGFIGLIFAIIGVILLILGRHAFGDRHSIFVGISVALWLVGFIGGIILLALVTSSISSAVSGNSDPSNPARALSGVFNGYLTAAIFVGAIAGLSNVLLTYQLQARKGRIMLWAGYGVGILVGMVVFLIISPAVPAAVTQSFASGTFDRQPLDQLRANIQGLRLLNIFPALVFAAGYYLAWLRIDNGDIPKTEQSRAPAPVTSGNQIPRWPGKTP